MASREEVAQVKDRHSDRLLDLPGVVGVGVTEDEGGEYVLTVHVETDEPEVRAQLPDELEGCPVRVVQTGRYRKF
ncbi:MAG TPA: hypothetical protein VF297_28535 [Pyrinomonadaceae bacterium]